MRARPRRGDIWYVDFGRPTGHEQGTDLRPALVVSTDELNESGAGLVIVAPLTTAQRGYPSRVRIPAGTSGLRETSWGAVEHLRSVSLLRLHEYRGSVGGQILDQVERVMAYLSSSQPVATAGLERWRRPRPDLGVPARRRPLRIRVEGSRAEPGSLSARHLAALVSVGLLQMRGGVRRAANAGSDHPEGRGTPAPEIEVLTELADPVRSRATRGRGAHDPPPAAEPVPGDSGRGRP